MLICGVDESGKGSVLGSLIVSAVIFDPDILIVAKVERDAIMAEIAPVSGYGDKKKQLLGFGTTIWRMVSFHLTRVIFGRLLTILKLALRAKSRTW
uniref:Ribonuclease HII n=1 Tax=Marseillevirus LCMAC201 TaxID=2506605 RepID=A0A481YWE1_9VIRU|nr:MAG: ribonuclease HII [Marseillevirus LCMAC201]